MKLTITLVLLLHFSTTFSQWTRVTELGSSNIFTLYHKDSVLYAGGTNTIYISNNKGLTWNSTSIIPGLSQFDIISNIIIHKNELFAVASHVGVAKSSDGGRSWQNVSDGIDPTTNVTDICEFKGDLYISTEGSFGSPILKLDPVSRTHWISFNNGLSPLSSFINSIVSTSTTMVAGAHNNSLYDYLAPNSTIWEERFLTNPPINNEGSLDIITAHDTLFFPGKTGFFYISTNNGLNWIFFGSRLVTGNTNIVNAKQALIASRYIGNTTLFYYIKKDSLQFPFKNFSTVTNHFSWKLDIIGDKLWDASDGGLFYMPLSELPGITAPEDSEENIPLPVHFISFNANCNENKIQLTWKTAQEINADRFNIERSKEGVTWTVIGTVSASGNSSAEKIYSFTDNNPGSNNFYRISENDLDGTKQISKTINSSCSSTTAFLVWPNPVHDRLIVRLVASNNSNAVIKIVDSKGSVIKTKQEVIAAGNNQLTIDMSSSPNGIYYVIVNWDNGISNKSFKIIKQ